VKIADLNQISDVSDFHGIQKLTEIPDWYFKTLKISAAHRNIYFFITKEEINSIYTRQKGLCALTGQPIWFTASQADCKLQSASLDRINSDRGYDFNNGQMVNKEINIMKGSFSQERFIELCLDVATHINTADEEFLPRTGIEMRRRHEIEEQIKLEREEQLKLEQEERLLVAEKKRKLLEAERLKTYLKTARHIDEFVSYINKSFKNLRCIKANEKKEELVIQFSTYFKEFSKENTINKRILLNAMEHRDWFEKPTKTMRINGKPSRVVIFKINQSPPKIIKDIYGELVTSMDATIAG
jgi:hypothetical protein